MRGPWASSAQAIWFPAKPHVQRSILNRFHMLAAELIAEFFSGLHHERQLLQGLADGKRGRGGGDGQRRAKHTVPVANWDCQANDTSEKLLVVDRIAALLDLADLPLQCAGIANRILCISMQSRHLQ